MTKLQKDLICRYIFLIVLVLVAYGNTLNHGFVWDDIDIIVDSPLLEKLGNIPKFFISEDKTDTPTGYYRPVTYVSFALDRAAWGLNPVGFNITNLVLHILVTLFFYRVVAALFKREDLAFVAALIFSLHPIAGETVNFHAGGRNTLLCACFTLLSLLFYINKKHLPAIMCFTMAIFSKEFALLLPAFFILYDRTIKEEKTEWITYVPYVISAASYLGLRSLAVANASLLKNMNTADTFWLIPGIIVTYLKNMAFPLGLKTFYDVSTHVTWPGLAGYSSLILLVIAAAVILREKREILFSICLFFIFLLPVTNVFNIGTAMMADRHAYFPLFGFSLALAYCICQARKQLAVAIMVLLCAFYITIDVQRNRFWKDEVSFFTQMIQDAPEMSTGFQNLGYAYYNIRDFTNAEKHLTVAYTKKGLNGNMLTGSASMFLDMNKQEKAIAVLLKKIAYEPKNPMPYIMASRIYEGMGNKEMATLYHDKAAALYPGIFEMMKQRAIAACRQGEALLAKHNTVKAERLFKEALSIDPLFVPALIDMGGLVAEKGDSAKSLQYFSKAAGLDPLNPAPHYNLSMVYESLGKKAEAQEEMDKFNRLSALSQKRNAAP